ncbi:MAG TPA: FG-GAP-like repeat-containing protein [Tepidisphaeraceae bacterium]
MLESLEDRKLLAAVAFAAPVTTQLQTTQYSITSVISADVNGDGIPDLLVGHNNGAAQVFLGTATGIFTSGTLVGPGAQLLAAASFTASGNTDLATATGVLPGNDNGTFGPSGSNQTYALPANTAALYAADVNGDGKEDLIAVTLTPAGSTSQPATMALSVMLGNGDGTFKSPVSTAVGSATGLTAIFTTDFQFDDFNNDGAMDVLTPFGVMLGNGTGAFGAPIPFPQPAGTSSGSGSGSSGSPGSGSSGSTSGSTTPAALPSNPAVAVADFNGDGNLDVAILPPGGGPTGQVDILLGNGDGTFTNGAPVALDPSTTITALGTGDLNGDGSPDLIVGTTTTPTGSATSTSAVQVVINAGNATFGTPTSFAVTGQPVSISTGDFNSDGNLDMAVVTAPLGVSTGPVFNQVLMSNALMTVFLNSKAVPITPTVTLGVSSARVMSGASLTFSAVVSPPPPPPVTPGTIPTSTNSPVPTGTVTFMEGSASIGTATLKNGRAKLVSTLSGVGTQAVTAVYGGDVTYAGATSAAKNVTVLLSTAATPLLIPTLSTVTIPSTFLPKDPGSVTLSFSNGGAGVANGRISVNLFLSPSRTLDPSSAIPVSAPSLQNRTLTVGVGGTATMTGNFKLGEYPPGTYFLIAQIVPVARFTTDQFTTTTLTSGSRFQAAGMVFGTIGNHKNLTLAVTDAAGNRAVLSITGNGSGTVTQTNGLTDVALSGTDSSSRFVVTPSRGTFSFDAITDSGALGAITGNRATVTGKLTVGGSIGNITLAALGQGGSMPVTLGSGVTVTLSLGAVSGVLLNSAAPIRSLTASSWVGGQIIAPSIQTLNVRGTCDPDVFVHGSGAIQTATLGTLDGGTWAIGGNIGTLHVKGNFSNAPIYAGADAGTDNVLGTNDDRYTVATISSVFVGGADTSSLVAAGAAPAPGGTIQSGIVLLPKAAIRSITVRGPVSDDSRFLAAVLPARAILSGVTVSTATDPHFQI